MPRHRSTLALVAVAASYFCIATTCTAQDDSKPKWIAEAESALVGTWQDTDERMPDLDIRINRDVLKVRMIDPEAEEESYDQLFVLANSESDEGTNAFASIDAEGVETHLTMLLKDENLQVNVVQIYKDSSGRANRMVNVTYIASEADDDDPAPNRKRVSSARKTSRSKAKKSGSASASKLGRISGEIATRSTLRGIISLTPAPKSIRPADGLIKISGTNPKFDFTKLPAGEYDLSFKGTINGSTRTVEWKGIKPDPPGSDPSLSLSLRPSKN